MNGLDKDIEKKIRTVFSTFGEIDKVVLYGSRAKGNYKKGSDIDLTFFGTNLKLKTLFMVQEKLDELYLPYKFDLSIFHNIDNKELIEHINRVGKVFYRRDGDSGAGARKGWEEKKLGEVCSFLNRGISPKYVENKGVCVLNQKCIRDHSVSYEQSRRHDLSIKPVSPERFIKLGDVLVNSTGTGTLGRVAQVREAPKEKTTVDSHVTVVRPKEGMFFPEFFGYMLILIEEAIKESGEGCGGQTELARSVLADKFHVSYPNSLLEQKRIVAILDEAFSGISRAKEIAEKNLANAKEVFESYLQNVFANPGKGWENKTLAQVSTIFGRGKSKHRPRNDPKLYKGKYPFIQTGDIRNSNHLITEYSQTYNDAGLAQSKLWPKGTLCITIAANIAETGILNFDSCFPDSVIGLVANPKIADVHFIEYLLQSFKSILQAKGKGSAQANINLATFENEHFPFPPLSVQKDYVKKLDSLAEQTKELESNYRQKLAFLEELKKSILAKAFSGTLTGGTAS